jgi:hypothetical protein
VTATAHFASLRAELIVVEQPAQPVFSNGRQIRTDPGKYHTFRDHRCQVTGQKSIDFLRERCRAHDAPGLWELDASDVPEVTSLLAELATADVARVREILQAEEKTSARRVVIETCHAVLQRAGAGELNPGQRPKAQTVTA